MYRLVIMLSMCRILAAFLTVEAPTVVCNCRVSVSSMSSVWRNLQHVCRVQVSMMTACVCMCDRWLSDLNVPTCRWSWKSCLEAIYCLFRTFGAICMSKHSITIDTCCLGTCGVWPACLWIRCVSVTNFWAWHIGDGKVLSLRVCIMKTPRVSNMLCRTVGVKDSRVTWCKGATFAVRTWLVVSEVIVYCLYTPYLCNIGVSWY